MIALRFQDTISGIFVDPSLTGKKRSDFMAVDVWGFRDGKFFCFYSEWVKRDFVAAVEAVRRIYSEWPALHIVIEATANGPAIANMLELEGVIGVTLVTPQDIAQKGQTNDASKLGRARAASFYFRSHRCYFDTTAPWFLEKKRYMQRFPGSTHDDMVDTAVMAVIWLQFTYGGGMLFENAMAGLKAEQAKVPTPAEIVLANARPGAIMNVEMAGFAASLQQRASENAAGAGVIVPISVDLELAMQAQGLL